MISRSICDYFFDAQSKSSDGLVPPVIATPHHFLISVNRGGIDLVAIILTEVPPLFVVEFLHRVFDTLNDYFGDCTETIVKVSACSVSVTHVLKYLRAMLHLMYLFVLIRKIPLLCMSY